MSLTKKRKQLIAASLAAMTAFGATVPAIVASAPAAFAAVDQASLGTALESVVIGSTATGFTTDETNLSTGTLVVKPGSTYAADTSGAIDDAFFKGTASDGLANKLYDYLNTEITSSSFNGSAEAILTVQEDGANDQTVTLTKTNGTAWADDITSADALATKLVTAFTDATQGGDNKNNLAGHTYTLKIEQSGGPAAITLTLDFMTQEEVQSEALEAAVTSTLTEENLAKLLVADYVSASTDGSDGSQGDPFVLTAGTNFTTSNGSTPLTGLVADADSSSLADALYDWANTNASSFTGKTVQLVVDTDPASTAETVDLISGGAAVAANTIADDLETALSTLSIADLSALAEKTLSFTLKTSDDASQATTTKYLQFPALTDDSAPAAQITYQVNSDPAVDVTGGAATIEVEVGDTITLADGSETITQTNETQDDSNAVTVESNTSITADATGTATVTVTTNSGSIVLTINVSEPAPAAQITYQVNSDPAVDVTGGAATIEVEVGDTITLADGSETITQTNETQDDSNAVTVESNTSITADAVGTATVTVTTNSGSIVLTINVSEPAPAPLLTYTGTGSAAAGGSITSTTQTIELEVGDTITLANGTATISAVADEVSPATDAVSVQDNTIKANAAGSETVTVTTGSDPIVLTINVSEPAPAAQITYQVNSDPAVDVTGGAATIEVEVGDTITLADGTATISAVADEVSPATDAVSVQGNTITANAAGSETVTVTTDGEPITLTINVAAAPESQNPVVAVTPWHTGRHGRRHCNYCSTDNTWRTD